MYIKVTVVYTRACSSNSFFTHCVKVHALEDIPVTVFTRFHSQNQYHISCIFAIKQIHIPTPTIVVLTMKMCLLLWLLLALVGSLPLVSSYRPAQPSFRLSTSEERQTEMAEANMGLDDVSNAQEPAALRKYLLRNKKQTGFLEKGQSRWSPSCSLASLLVNTKSVKIFLFMLVLLNP